MPKPTQSDHEALLKLERYCAYQERCTAEVLDKMAKLEIPANKHDELLAYLQDDGYVNDERYAIGFASGKFRFKKWGRIKIRYELASKMVAEKYIDKALNALDAEEYEAILKGLLKEKRKTLPHVKDPYQLNHKVSIFAIGKGFEPELVWTLLKKGRF